VSLLEDFNQDEYGSHRSSSSENIQETQRNGIIHPVIDSSSINALAREKSLGRGRDWESSKSPNVMIAQETQVADEIVIPKHNRSISMSRGDESFLRTYNAELIALSIQASSEVQTNNPNLAKAKTREDSNDQH